LALYANGVLGRTAFGKDFYEGGEYDRHGFANMLEDYQVLLGGFSLADYFPSMEWVGALTGNNARLERTVRRFDKFFDEIIEEHMKKRRDGIVQEEQNIHCERHLKPLTHLHFKQNIHQDYIMHEYTRLFIMHEYHR
jgi:hypothetical protein